VNAVCGQVEVSATGQSLVEGSPAEYGLSECHLETSRMRRLRLTRTVGPLKGGRGRNFIRKSLVKNSLRC